MEEEMRELLTKRRQTKGTITRALTYAQNPPDHYTLGQIEARLNRLEVAWQEFQSYSLQLYSYEQIEGFVDPEEELVSYEEKFIMSQGILFELKRAIISPQPQNEFSTFSRLAEQQSTLLQRFSESPVTTQIRDNDLPKINIQPFTGVYKDWPAFRDIFTSTIDSKPGLTNTQKFHHLKSLLKGDAANLIKHLQITDSAYATAWERLKERFDKPRQIVTSFIESFMSLPSTSIESAAGLRKVSDGANEVIRGLDAIDQSERDHWLIYLLQAKLDPESRRKWIETSRSSAKPTINEFFEFLDLRCEELELSQRKSASSTRQSSNARSHTSQALVTVNENQQRCIKCAATDHWVTKCPKFLSMSIVERRSFTKDKSLCFNCIKAGHNAYNCRSTFRCKNCNSRHHTLLHSDSTTNHASSTSTISRSTNQAPVDTQLPTTSNAPKTVSLNSVVEARSSSVDTFLDHQVTKPLLPTALVDVCNGQGQFVICRVLLDSASELSYITERCIQRLGLSRSSSRIAISGISSLKGETTRGCSTLHIRSRVSHCTLNARVHILSQITASLPKSSIANFDQHSLANVTLADPSFNCSSPIDILLGADYVWDIFTMEKLFNANGNTIAISTRFGWVVTSVSSPECSSPSLSLVSLTDIDQSLRSFWEVEEAHSVPPKDAESLLVEEHFRKTHTRHSDGRYVVQLPFIEEGVTFADTLQGALSRFTAVERRLQRDQSLRMRYIKFIREYIELGHMRELAKEEISVTDNRVFYMPHHPVVGVKLRVVFDGSFGDVMGVSLNSKLHIGPCIQRNLFAVCLRFRFHKFVFSADIVKMFRQIWVAEEQRNFQRIVWRESPDEPIKHYQLCTVTYGTASAPFLSVRVLEQIAEDYKDTHPIASKVLLEDFYVDDVLTGASTEEELVTKRNELIHLLSLAGLQLSKWVSNSRCITLHANDQQDHSFLQPPENESTKVLGIHWQSSVDLIGYKVALGRCQNATKRQVLSEVSRVFDPLGLIAPVVINFKILFQELWLLSIDWDDPLPDNIANLWLQYREDIHHISNLKLNRYIFNLRDEIELHGFSDASIKAYSAVVYCRAKDEQGNIQVSLVAAKTRVAPLQQISLPRLELCGALLLARLMNKIVAALPNRTVRTHAWCDSTIVISWLSLQPIKLKTFVANRTSEILNTLPRHIWKHVSSKENPADCASRGMMANQLMKFNLWWKGPSWLQHEDEANDSFAQQVTNWFAEPEVVAEMRTNAITMVTSQMNKEHPIELLVDRVSSWWKLLRVTAYILRFIHRIKSKKKPAMNHLTYEEINEARVVCLFIAQNGFSKERQSLQQRQELQKGSKLLNLTPFIDNKELIRVGGRIKNSEHTADTQHPIILPKEHRITSLILLDEHIRNLHPGVSALCMIIRQKYWVIGARNLIRKLTHNCLKCFRQRQQTSQQLMADLPAVRVRQAYPFENAGCDYAGPFILKIHRGRNSRTSKGYICLFVCMVTSAIHLELATDLSTDCFIAALRRFISRRGKCAHIFSDNGKNFVCASRTLDEMHQILKSQTHTEIVAAFLAKEGIKWTYIPPYAPHWGGIWESAVRSVKLHLRRVIGKSILTFEQMNTLLAQIEAIVNSRPLGAAPDTDTNYLSPSHFLIGRPYTMIAEGSLTSINPNRLDYWQHVQNMQQGFWERWHKEYLTSLQQRPKWCRQQQNIEVGNLVIVKDSGAPPATWITAKVTETFPGKDGLTRVVKLHTAHGEMIRPISKLVVLPLC